MRLKPGALVRGNQAQQVSPRDAFRHRCYRFSHATAVKCFIPSASALKRLWIGIKITERCRGLRAGVYTRDGPYLVFV
jgi:hypothetical protein